MVYHWNTETSAGGRNFFESVPGWRDRRKVSFWVFPPYEDRWLPKHGISDLARLCVEPHLIAVVHYQMESSIIGQYFVPGVARRHRRKQTVRGTVDKPPAIVSSSEISTSYEILVSSFGVGLIARGYSFASKSSRGFC